MTTWLGSRVTIVALATVSAGLGLAGAARASSHSDAPLIKQDPQANLTDVYAFIGTRYNDPGQNVLNVIVNVRPFSEPGDGAIYERFADDARYSIHITNPSTGETLTRYDFLFSRVDQGYKNVHTLLQYGLGTEVGPIQNVDDARQNFTQTYRIEKVQGGSTTVIATGLKVPPPNTGRNTTPLYNDALGRPRTGASSFAELDRYTQQTIYGTATGEASFAGSRDDSFFADPPAIFDLLDARILDNNGTLADGLGQDGNGFDGFKGFNVLTYALQIPLSSLSPSGYTSVFFGPQTGVGVYASVSRPMTRTITAEGERINSAQWVQVNRLGNPLFNEGLVATVDKDKYNRTSPTDDAAMFSHYASNPELAALINFVYGTSFVAAGRSDLVNVYVPDVIRVNTTTGAVRLPGEPGFSRLGFLGGDTTAGVSSGWPNGRRLGDDVVDIALTAIASGPSYSTITIVGDNVPGNDLPYHNTFPYAATPQAGLWNRKDRVSGDLDDDQDCDLVDLALLLSRFGRIFP